jgi:RecA-family ATPase
LAPGYLAAGKVNLLVGDEGIGKSLWTIRAIASITTGKPWGPFTIASEPADVILIATEDGWADTIRPRLEVAEADLDSSPTYVSSSMTAVATSARIASVSRILSAGSKTTRRIPCNS